MLRPDMYHSKPGLIGLAGMVLLLASTVTFARAAGCPATELGMNVVLPNGKTVEGLTVKNVTGSTKRDPVAIDSLTFDTSPRRILLVLDMGRDLTADARRAQLEI